MVLFKILLGLTLKISSEKFLFPIDVVSCPSKTKNLGRYINYRSPDVTTSHFRTQDAFISCFYSLLRTEKVQTRPMSSRLGTFKIYADKILPIIDHPTGIALLKWEKIQDICFHLLFLIFSFVPWKNLRTVDISSTTHLPFHVKVW